MDIVEGEQLLCAVEAPVGCPEALRMANRRPASSGQGPQFERATLVEADDRATFGAAFVEVEDAVFFDSNSASGDCFQVLVCWYETPSSRSVSRFVAGNSVRPKPVPSEAAICYAPHSRAAKEKEMRGACMSTLTVIVTYTEDMMLNANLEPWDFGACRRR